MRLLIVYSLILLFTASLVYAGPNIDWGSKFAIAIPETIYTNKIATVEALGKKLFRDSSIPLSKQNWVKIQHTPSSNYYYLAWVPFAQVGAIKEGTPRLAELKEILSDAGVLWDWDKSLNALLKRRNCIFVEE